MLSWLSWWPAILGHSGLFWSVPFLFHKEWREVKKGRGKHIYVEKAQVLRQRFGSDNRACSRSGRVCSWWLEIGSRRGRRVRWPQPRGNWAKWMRADAESWSWFQSCQCRKPTLPFSRLSPVHQAFLLVSFHRFRFTIASLRSAHSFLIFSNLFLINCIFHYP